jgi:hypothetical protein
VSADRLFTSWERLSRSAEAIFDLGDRCFEPGFLVFLSLDDHLELADRRLVFGNARFVSVGSRCEFGGCVSGAGDDPSSFIKPPFDLRLNRSSSGNIRFASLEEGLRGCKRRDRSREAPGAWCEQFAAFIECILDPGPDRSGLRNFGCGVQLDGFQEFGKKYKRGQA